MARDRGSGAESRSLRLFVAFDVSAGAADAVARAVEPWTGAIPHVRWVPRENWHVTLKFLGQTWPRLEGWVRDRVGEVARRSGSVPTRLTAMGSFPGRGRARVLWAGIDDASGALGGIAAALDEALRQEFRPEARPFSPHLTVARSEPPVRLPEGFAEPLPPVAFTVDRVVLFRSHLRRPAPRYEPLEIFPLIGPLVGS
jgi:RNA 2',3'-cyclic 3'-phosphodiesterase